MTKREFLDVTINLGNGKTRIRRYQVGGLARHLFFPGSIYRITEFVEKPGGPPAYVRLEKVVGSVVHIQSFVGILTRVKPVDPLTALAAQAGDAVPDDQG